MMVNPEMIIRSENKIKMLKEHLESLNQFKGELDGDILKQWFYGVVAPIFKGTSDVSMDILEKLTGPAGKSIKQGYEIGQKTIDIGTETSRNGQILNGLEFHDLIEGENGGNGVYSIFRSIEDFKNGNIKESIGSIVSSGEDFGLVKGGTSSVYGALNNFYDAYENGKDINLESSRLKDMFNQEVKLIEGKLLEEEGLLYKYSEGKKGNIEGLLNSKNKFRRLDGVLMQIKLGLNKVQQNLR